MQAIETKFISPTNLKGSRISARCESGRVIVDWDHALDAKQNHINAAKHLLKKLGWDYNLLTGSLKNSYVHILEDK